MQKLKPKIGVFAHFQLFVSRPKNRNFENIFNMGVKTLQTTQKTYSNKN